MTAVEWMVEKLFKPMDNPPIENVSDIIKQAKEMEKQQIIDFAVWFNNDFAVWFNNNDNSYKSYTEIIKQYYNETFKNK